MSGRTSKPEPPNGKVRRRVMHPNVDQQRTRCLAENKRPYPIRRIREAFPATNGRPTRIVRKTARS